MIKVQYISVKNTFQFITFAMPHPIFRKSEHISDFEQKYNIVRRVFED